MKRFRRWFLRLLGWLVVLVLAALAVIGWLGSSHLVSPERRVLQGYHRQILSDPADFGLAVDRWSGPADTPALVVTASAAPGTARKARELRRLIPDAPRWASTVGTVVLLHGHRGRKEDLLPVCERFCAAGFRCVVIDLPGHGDHPSRFATFGHEEVGLLGEIRNAFPDDHPCFLFGMSQGGAIALQAAASQPERWSGVISVAAFATLDEALMSSARDFHPVARPLSPLLAMSVAIATRCRAGFFPAAIRPIDAAGALDLPVLLVHGGADRFIPVEHARRLHRALPSPRKDLLIIDGAGHGRVLAADAANTYAACARFMLQAAE
ncbi:alpha/beta hydrolase [Haloferula sp. A504]|uniref:alpha/beta hydrolase n=1 Tax=Haloferula sp. A504 TaxID=3373601 RepID=UPI0031C1B4AA|nr:lysophospholipase [Verrucomicrobiaceae bacterium E54]